MIIDNSVVLQHMKDDLEYFYYDFADIKARPQAIICFSNSTEHLKNHDFIIATKDDDEIFISLHTNDKELISEAVSYAKDQNLPNVYLSFDNDVDITTWSQIYQLEPYTEQRHNHFGIYGAIKDPESIAANKDINVCPPSQSDVEYISSLSNKEWVFLPQRIRFLKDSLLLAKRNDELLGFIFYGCGEKGYDDIGMIFVHPDYRRMGVGTALVKGFAMDCKRRGVNAYYVCAGSKESANLAKSLHVREVREPNAVYKLIL